MSNLKKGGSSQKVRRSCDFCRKRRRHCDGDGRRRCRFVRMLAVPENLSVSTYIPSPTNLLLERKFCGGKLMAGDRIKNS